MESREEIADTGYRGNEVVRSCAIAQKISRFESPSARYCSCPTFLHSREEEKVAAATVPTVTSAAVTRLPSPPKKRRKHERTKKQMGQKDKKKKKKKVSNPLLRKKQILRRREPRSLLYTGEILLLFFSAFRRWRSPLPSPSRQCHFPRNRTTDCRHTTESEISTGENQVLARNVP